LKALKAWGSVTTNCYARIYQIECHYVQPILQTILSRQPAAGITITFSSFPEYRNHIQAI
jgi:hypothetical protein